ncbi:hypothetical protein BJ322DRAFT_140781 [Thelephora terrestris]|uniref:F-box domain-containing protein n=1 Tax=Thelephora terrestris TaxID=56493 RepID=A0A9P6L5M0_9AGAM|nr:hypothetical protein BJ322DRAFT_140781 [Thelephora terrestris]
MRLHRRSQGPTVFKLLMGDGIDMTATRPFHNAYVLTAIMGPNPQEPEGSVILPPETLDQILEHIPTDREGTPTLLSCALVATWWTDPSQRRLFSSVSINDKNYRQWMDGIVLSESKDRLLRYIRSFLHSRSLGDAIRYPMWNLPRDSGEYLSGLHNVRSLTLRNITIEDIGEESFDECFSAFRETLTELSLELFAMSFDAFVTVVDYFPNLTTLRLGSFALRCEELWPAPSLSRPLRGKICIHNPNLIFVAQLAELDLEYDSLVIESSLGGVGGAVESALQVSASTVRYLRLAAPLRPGANAWAFDHLPQLRELELLLNWSSSVHEGLLSSIISTELRRVVFLASPIHDWNIFSQGMGVWSSIDVQLCELVARLGRAGRCHTLEVEFRLLKDGKSFPGHELSKLLAGFRDVGTVIITYAAPSQS